MPRYLMGRGRRLKVNSIQIVKRALLIVAAVAGYSFVETAVLLSVIAPRESVSTSVTGAALVGWSQFLLIPAMGVLFSRVIYGSRKLGRRALIALLIGPLVFCLFLSPFAAIALIFDWTFIVSRIILAVVTAVLFVAMAAALRWCLRRSRQWNAEAEAERWLAERQSRPSERKWRSRSICFALCMPFTIVLLIFLFVPETWGLISHIAYPHADDLPGYRVKIPVRWIILSGTGEQSNGSSRVSGIAGKGIGLGGNPLRHDSLLAWQIGTKSFDRSEGTDYDRWLHREGDILSRSVIVVGNESLVCLDYWPSYDGGPPRSVAATIANVTCGGSTRLVASFYGKRNQLPAFYRMLSEITQGG